MPTGPLIVIKRLCETRAMRERDRALRIQSEGNGSKYAKRT